MTISIEKSDSISKQLYDILVSRNFDVTATDLYGKTITDPSEVSVFSFIYKTENKSYGHVVIALDSENNIEFMYSGNMASEMEREDREGWYNFLQLIRVFAKRNLLKFSAKDISKVKYTMQGIAASMNESKLVESYYGNKHTSFSDLPESTKLVIKHNKSIGESDLRYRHIESIFIETAEGERFKVPSKSLAEAKALARHVAEGGKPYDKIGKYISEMASECRTLSKLKRKYNGAEDLNEDEASMVNTGLARFESLRKDLKKCASKKGYAEIKESLLAELDEQKKNVKESKMKKKMRELDIFESWASSIVEGSWTIPDTPGKQEELAAILREPLPVGPDATNAISTLTDLIGDRELHQRLEKVAANDADADAVPTVVGWMEENSNNPTIKTVLDMITNNDVAPPAEEPAPEPEMPAEEPAPEPEMPAEEPPMPRRESKEVKKKVVECWVKPFAVRMVEHNGLTVKAMVFESSMHAKQYVKHNPGTEHLFTDDVGAYVCKISESPTIKQRLKTIGRKLDPTMKSKLRAKADQKWNDARLGNPDDEYDEFRRHGPFANDAATRHIGQHNRYDRLAKGKQPFKNNLDDNSLDQLVNEYDDDYEDDDQEPSEFYVAMYDEDENTTFVGGVRNDGGRDGWSEFAVAGERPYNWGSGSYMGYLTPDQVMSWLYKDYDRGYEIKGPFFSKADALEWARHNFGPLGEDKETQAYIALGGQTAHRVKGSGSSTRSLVHWKQQIKKASPWADIVSQGDRLVAKMGDQILGSFDFRTKEGHIFAEARKPKNKKV